MERFDLIIGGEIDDGEAGAATFMFARPAARPALLPRDEEIADPEAGWARRNPDRAMAFLYVCPRDCGAIDELLAA